MSEPLLRVEDLHRRFGGVAALSGVSLSVEVGELRCIIGPNGAGKSTLFNLLCGTLRPSAGQIRFAGRDIVGLPVHHFARIGIARKFQVPSVFDTMTVRENLEVSTLRRSAVEIMGRVDQMLQMLSLSALAEVPSGDLAHGQKQWLEIGMALMSEPKLLLLDEPTAGMSREETRRTADLLHSLNGDVTIIAIEHDMSFVRALNCRTVVLHRGRIIADGPFGTIERDETVRDVYLGRH